MIEIRVVAELRVAEISDTNIETLKTVFLVDPGETVEALLGRIGMTGAQRWHYDSAEVRLKLAKPRKEVEG